MLPEEALAALLKALPRCCNCQTAVCVIIDDFRWPLCEKCWKAVPESDTGKPQVDMREAVAAAQRAVRASLSESLSKILTHSEIPPPPSSPTDLGPSELEVKNKRLLRKIRRMREARVRSVRRVGIAAFLLGMILGALITAALH